MNKKNEFALVPRPPSEIEKAEPGAKRVLSGMVADTLTLVKKDFGQKPTFTILVGLDHFAQLMELILASKLAETHDLDFFYFARSSELLRLAEEHPFDLVSLYVGNIIWDTDRNDGSFCGAASVLGSLKARYGKPIVATQGMDLSAELEPKGIIFLQAPYEIKDFWARLRPQLAVPVNLDSSKQTFSLAICGLSPGADFETLLLAPLLRGILGPGYLVTFHHFPYAQWEGTFDDYNLLVGYDLLVIFLNPILHVSRNAGESDVAKLVAKLKVKSQRPTIVLTNGVRYGLNLAAEFREAGADAYFSFLPPFPTEPFKQALKNCIGKSLAERARTPQS